MTKNYDLYPKSERKIDNWRKRILGYEKMKRDMQRQIQLLRNENKKQKEVIDKAINYLEEHIKYECDNVFNGMQFYSYHLYDFNKQDLLDILKEVSE